MNKEWHWLVSSNGLQASDMRSCGQNLSCHLPPWSHCSTYQQTMSVHKLPSYQRRRPEETLLYKTVATHLNTFLANLAEEGKSLPKHVEKELWAFLECGILAYGFVRLKCTGCKSEQFVAFSCKKRGFCPSCGGKWMAETAAHLVDNILPRVKIRQYVLSVPIPLALLDGI